MKSDVAGAGEPDWLAPFLASLDLHFVEALVGCLEGARFFAKDRLGRFVLCDDRFLEILGCTRREEVIGRTDFDFFPRESAEKFVADDRTVLRTGRPIRNLPEPNPNRDMTFTWWSVSKVPMRNHDGVIVGVAGVISRLAPFKTPETGGGELFAALEVIGKRYGEPLDVAALATAAGLSVRAFQRHFRKVLRTAPMPYLRRVRLQAARHRLLHSDQTLGEIASECGFYDQSHMSRLFKHSFGLAPLAFRKRHLAPDRQAV